MLQDKIDNNPAFVAEAYKKAQRQYRTEFVTEVDIDSNITEEEAKKLAELQKQVMVTLDRRIVQLKERQILIDKKAELVEKRWEIEVMLWRQKVQEKELEVKGYEEILELKKREVKADELRRKVTSQMDVLENRTRGLLPGEEIDSVTKAEQWVINERDSVSAASRGAVEAVDVQAGKMTRKMGPIIEQTAEAAMGSEKQKNRKGKVHNSERDGSMTSSQVQIQNLQAEVR